MEVGEVIPILLLEVVPEWWIVSVPVEDWVPRVADHLEDLADVGCLLLALRIPYGAGWRSEVIFDVLEELGAVWVIAGIKAGLGYLGPVSPELVCMAFC